MPNESERTSRLLSRLRKLRPRWEVWKVNDRVAHGRPDVVIFSDLGVVWAIEFKRCPVGANPAAKLTAGQRQILDRLSRLLHRVRVVALHPDGTHTVWGGPAGSVIPLGPPSRTALFECLEIPVEELRRAA